jgi:NADPH:quinone reductase-like Zn-dependent oxidoreductase
LQLKNYERRHNVKYKRVVVTRHGPPNVMRIVEEELPEPQAGQVRVKVLAAGVSAFDLMLRRSGSIPGFPRVPFTPGVDVVGVAEKLGRGVTTVEPEELVAGFTKEELGSLVGGYAEFVCVTADMLVPVPSGVDPAQAVCLVANYLTAHMALHETAKIRPGERVLVQGAAGGVGTALLQLGKLCGLVMYGTASEHNHDLVSELGATPIDYRGEDFLKRIRSLTGDGVDAVFDPIGGARQLWRSYRALRAGGRLVWFGVAAVAKRGIKVIPSSLLMRFLLNLIPDGKRAPLSGDILKSKPLYHKTLEGLLDSLAKGKIRPIVAARVPLVEAVRAHELLERGGHAGKFVLVTEA